jgi:GNAT superfamily N-acetyltransferase
MLAQGLLFSYVDQNELIGGALLFAKPPILYVGRIFIAPKYFRQGYGLKLMEEIENLFTGIKVVRTETPVWNVRTNSFYPKCGYVETGRDSESVYFEKRLGP